MVENLIHARNVYHQYLTFCHRFDFDFRFGRDFRAISGFHLFTIDLESAIRSKNIGRIFYTLPQFFARCDPPAVNRGILMDE